MLLYVCLSLFVNSNFLFGFFHRTTRNPHSTDRYTGGSSSGPAAIVASGLCSAALGTDGGGCIRVVEFYTNNSDILVCYCLYLLLQVLFEFHLHFVVLWAWKRHLHEPTWKGNIFWWVPTGVVFIQAISLLVDTSSFLNEYYAWIGEDLFLLRVMV